jgi:hypothetical protein
MCLPRSRSRAKRFGGGSSSLSRGRSARYPRPEAPTSASEDAQRRPSGAWRGVDHCSSPPARRAWRGIITRASRGSIDSSSPSPSNYPIARKSVLVRLVSCSIPADKTSKPRWSALRFENLSVFWTNQKCLESSFRQWERFKSVVARAELPTIQCHCATCCTQHQAHPTACRRRPCSPASPVLPPLRPPRRHRRLWPRAAPPRPSPRRPCAHCRRARSRRSAHCSRCARDAAAQCAK